MQNNFAEIGLICKNINMRLFLNLSIINKICGKMKDLIKYTESHELLVKLDLALDIRFSLM